MASIDFNSVCFEYDLLRSEAKSLRLSLADKLTGGRFGVEKGIAVVKALNNVSLHLEKGTRLGLIGHNGSGKSTLLRLMAGIYQPTEGKIKTEGKIATLLSTGMGMNDSLSGYENIFLAGLMLGYTPEQIREREQEIADFTELGNFLSMRVSTYSSGMRARLAFAISTAINPEILLIDEVFGTGDASFMNKANKRIEKLILNASIMVFASHANSLIENYCNKVVYLEKGEVRFYGDTKTGLELYKQDLEKTLN